MSQKMKHGVKCGVCLLQNVGNFLFKFKRFLILVYLSSKLQ